MTCLALRPLVQIRPLGLAFLRIRHSCLNFVGALLVNLYSEWDLSAAIAGYQNASLCMAGEDRNRSRPGGTRHTACCPASPPPPPAGSDLPKVDRKSSKTVTHRLSTAEHAPRRIRHAVIVVSDKWSRRPQPTSPRFLLSTDRLHPQFGLPFRD